MKPRLSELGLRQESKKFKVEGHVIPLLIKVHELQYLD